MKPQTKASERTMVPTTAVRGDRLAERITNLSCPREYQSEKLDDGLIDSLPPEGEQGITDFARYGNAL